MVMCIARGKKMKIYIDEILKERNQSRYWLAKVTGITYPNITNLCNGKTSGIKFDIIEKICHALQCTPNDIFIIE